MRESMSPRGLRESTPNQPHLAEAWEMERSHGWEKGAKGIVGKKAKARKRGKMKAEQAGEGQERLGCAGRGPLPQPRQPAGARWGS